MLTPDFSIIFAAFLNNTKMSKKEVAAKLGLIKQGINQLQSMRNSNLDSICMLADIASVPLSTVIKWGEELARDPSMTSITEEFENDRTLKRLNRYSNDLYLINGNDYNSIQSVALDSNQSIRSGKNKRGIFLYRTMSEYQIRDKNDLILHRWDAHEHGAKNKVSKFLYSVKQDCKNP